MRVTVNAMVILIACWVDEMFETNVRLQAINFTTASFDVPFVTVLSLILENHIIGWDNSK